MTESWEVLNQFRVYYGNAMDEFADVEIFLISMDGLLMELIAHEYLRSDVGYQTIVLARQLDTFLEQLVAVGGKFKLIWFTDLISFYEKDSMLKFVRSFMEAHLLQSCRSNDVMTYPNISCPEWDNLLLELTPSFLMASVENVPDKFSKEVDFRHVLATIALSSLRAGIPVVLINGLVVNVNSVICHRIEPAVFSLTGWKILLKKFWPEERISLSFETICTTVLPFRLQQEFANLHSRLKMKLSLPIDMGEHLFNPSSSDEDMKKSIASRLLPIKNGLLKEYVLEYEDTLLNQELNLYEDFAGKRDRWIKFIPEKFVKVEELDNPSSKQRRKRIQFLYTWYEIFARSLEGRGTDLLVDFSRKSTKEESAKEKRRGKEGKGKKGAVKSKKELILEANLKKKNMKILQDERVMINFAVDQGDRAYHFLEELLNKLEMPASKAMCIYKQACAVLRKIEQLDGEKNLEARRINAVPLVGKLKELLRKYWDDLEDEPKKFVIFIYIYSKLGFGQNSSISNKISLNMNIIYYQLAYGGEIIDIECDSQKDDRVSGFDPDAWQRRLLDAVDERMSAVVIAPTSAGKTFVSYYCIEGILRGSDEDVVVYISPSKALLNQVCGSVYARFRNKTMTKGKSLFGTLTLDYAENAMNCQVLVTVPECLEKLMLSCDPTVREFVSKIKYAIFDEVHCISSSSEAHIWEHLLLLIQCPFLALSATVGNSDSLLEWLTTTEGLKRKNHNEVRLINYNERYSELELFLERINTINFVKPSISDMGDGLLQSFLPFAVFNPVKMDLFGIPADQQLTAKQVLELYHILSEVDPERFEPCKFYKFSGECIWLSRTRLRELENGLKQVILNWLQHDKDKLEKFLHYAKHDIEDELCFRNQPFNQLTYSMNSIVNVVCELRKENRLPAICFIDNRSACVNLAKKLHLFLEQEENKFRDTSEFKTNYAVKDEKKLLKLMKRNRDAKMKKKKKKKESDDEEEEDDIMSMQLKLKTVLYRLHVRHYDEELVERVRSRMVKKQKSHKDTTSILLQLFDRGIAFHHEGLSSIERGSIEILFRAGYIGMLFSTSTLALGVNMPCKTVIFGMDTPFLTPLLYRQMAGRAGRRGFDHSGNVVFMSMQTSKMRRLLTSSLSNLRGNFPFTTTYILRLFMFSYQIDETGNKTKVKKSLMKQLKLFTIYSVQLLRWLGTLDSKGLPVGLAPVVTYLSEYEPGNLVFVYLMQKNVFYDLFKEKLIIIFANLFTNVIVSPDWNSYDPTSSSNTAVSERLNFPPECKVYVDEYNAKVEELWNDYLTLFESDDKFHFKFSLKSMLTDVVRPCDSNFLFDERFFPVCFTGLTDYRGNKICRNAYAYDLWMNRSKKRLHDVCQIAESDAWKLIRNFNVILEQIATVAENIDFPGDPFRNVMRELSSEYDSIFKRVFKMRKKF
uniref:Helicase ATP-binding domain-containing protein n=1 Tax=Syphacia muris TaxID=451379 RepID=A0A0N5AYJ8_9BILA